MNENEDLPKPIDFQERHQLEDEMVLVSWMYYEEGFTQSEIAQKLNMSRVKIIRLLQKAKSEGIVQFKISKSLPEERNLEVRLEAEYDLTQAVVVRSKSTLDETTDDMGYRTAEIIRGKLFPECRLGVGWSTTILKVAPYLKKVTFDMTVNDLSGTFIGKTNPYSAAWLMAHNLGVKAETIPVPILIRNPVAYHGLLQEPSISEALDHAKKCDIIIFGIGNLDTGALASPTGYFREQILQHLHEMGAVGDILMRPFDITGNPIIYPLADQIITLTIEEVMKIPFRIAIAASESKAKAILGALRGGFIHCLITDSNTARKTLSISH